MVAKIEKPCRMSFEEIAEEAELAFWGKVAELCPEIKTGDFPPELTAEMRAKMQEWIKVWYMGNLGSRKVRKGSVNK